MRTQPRKPSSPAPHRQGGVVAVEFAITMFLLLLIGAGIVEFGRAFWFYDAVVKGTRDAARYLSTVPTASLAGVGTTTASNMVVEAATAGGVPAFSSANVSITCAPTACGAAVLPSNITSVTVSATYPMSIGGLFPFLVSGSAGPGSFDVTLAPHTTMPYLW